MSPRVLVVRLVPGTEDEMQWWCVAYEPIFRWSIAFETYYTNIVNRPRLYFPRPQVWGHHLAPMAWAGRPVVYVFPPRNGMNDIRYTFPNRIPPWSDSAG
jgi:hypothetical protein